MICKIDHLEKWLRWFESITTAFNKDLLELKNINQQFEDDLLEVQIKSLREVAKESWMLMEDRVVGEKLGGIHKEVEDWVADNCVRGFDEVRELTDKEQWELLNSL